MQGRCYCQLGEFEKAIACINKGYEFDPERHDAHGLLAEIYTQQKKI
jgi:cytochrome c-type biogenesis protein CcmH/NrfG